MFVRLGEKWALLIFLDRLVCYYSNGICFREHFSKVHPISAAGTFS